MPTADEVRERIEQHLPGAHVEVVDTTGTQDHFAASIVAPQFAGASLISQHRMVYAAVQDRLDDGSIHALSIKTAAPPGEEA